MIVNLINKHGLMPKKNFPESYSCEASARMNQVLKSKVSDLFSLLPKHAEYNEPFCRLILNVGTLGKLLDHRLI